MGHGFQLHFVVSVFISVEISHDREGATARHDRDFISVFSRARIPRGSKSERGETLYDT